MSPLNWNEAPQDAQYARHWLGKWHWFKRHPTLTNMWQKFDSGKWWLTSMDNCTFISLESRP